jgi:hypothetical protein
VSVRVKVSSNGLYERAQKAAEDAMGAVFRELDAEFDAAFSKKAWQWPRDLPTRSLKGATVREKLASYLRGEGTRAGNPRNIIDTAKTRAARFWKRLGPFRAEYRWYSPHATAVHEGALIYPWGNKKRRRVRLPPRPWTRAVLGTEQVAGIRVYPMAQRLRDVWLVKMRARR